MKKRKILSVLKRVVITAVVVVMLICLPSVKLKENDDLTKIYSVFLGTKSKYQGIIEIWNIDTFESGTTSKSKYLSQVTESFQKQNKGLYFMIRNLTEQECLNLIAGGEMPDLFSCSYGVAEKFKDYVKVFQNVDISALDSGAVDAGTLENELFGVPWCKGAYYLISTRQSLEKAGVQNVDDVKLSNICFSSGYVVHGKKSDKTVYSLSLGNSKYLMPQQAIKSYNEQGVESISELSFDARLTGQTGYSAYCNFIAGNSTILLGTQRDVFRMENRVKLGKASDVIYEQVLGFTDLIQFMLLASDVSGEKLEYVQKFTNYLIGERCQLELRDIGLLPMAKCLEIEKNESVMHNITPQNFEDYTAPKLFVSQNEINSLQQF